MNKIVKLNVGGVKYETTYETLVVEPLSKLALLVHHREIVEDAGSVEVPEEKMGEEGVEPEKSDPPQPPPEEIFIDRNGQLFEFVLEVRILLITNDEITINETLTIIELCRKHNYYIDPAFTKSQLEALNMILVSGIAAREWL